MSLVRSSRSKLMKQLPHISISANQLHRRTWESSPFDFLPNPQNWYRCTHNNVHYGCNKTWGRDTHQSQRADPLKERRETHGEENGRAGWRRLWIIYGFNLLSRQKAGTAGAWLNQKKRKEKKNIGREIQSKIQNERTLFNILNPWESLTSNRRQNHSFSPFIKANSACQGYEPHRWGPHWIPDIQAGLIYLANLLTKEVRNELFGEDLPVSRFFILFSHFLWFGSALLYFFFLKDCRRQFSPRGGFHHSRRIMSCS